MNPQSKAKSDEGNRNRPLCRGEGLGYRDGRRGETTPPREGTMAFAINRRDFGIGAAARLDWVEIKWPRPSTRVDRFTDLPLGRYIGIEEGAAPIL